MLVSKVDGRDSSSRESRAMTLREYLERLTENTDVDTRRRDEGRSIVYFPPVIRTRMVVAH